MTAALPERSPEAAGLVAGDALPERGRARRVRCAYTSGGDAGELWRFSAAPGEDGGPDGDGGAGERAARRLLALGGGGVGGFRAGGRDGDGPWLVRAPAEPSLETWLRGRGEDGDGAERAGGHAVPWRGAVAMVGSLLRAARACEDAALFPGPIAPSNVTVRHADSDVSPARAAAGGVAAVAAVRDSDITLELRAEPLVRAVAGAAASPRKTTSSRWMPPEQAAGAAWDNAANRYVIGLILYRLLAGEHPFAGRGLRLGLDEQAQRGAPPLPDDVAGALPPGLHSLCLRAIAPDPGDRPASAAAFADQLAAHLTPTEAARPTRPDPATARPARATLDATRRSDATRPARAAGDDTAPAPRRSDASTARPRPGRGSAGTGYAYGIRTFAVWAAPVVGVAAAALIVTSLDAAPAGTPRVGPRAAIASARTTVEDCAGCHPRQTGEWRRSIMAHAAKSPLFQALEILIEEQAGRDFSCPGGAGVLRDADPVTACRDRATGLPVTGSGGALWCANCHLAGYNLPGGPRLPAWDGTARVSATRLPLRDLLDPVAMEGISCAFCHQTDGPVHAGDARTGRYEGNPSWTSTATGRVFSMRPEDQRGLFGIANSGYSPGAGVFLASPDDPSSRLVPTGAHRRTPDDVRGYLRSSEFCGACHDVRLFGTDVLGSLRGEHFKRLRNAYSEWAAWADGEARAGRIPATCQDCHMSTYPGVCVTGEAVAIPDRRSATDTACPPGMRFEPRAPGEYPIGQAAAGSRPDRITTHYFSGVDLPLATEFDPLLVDDPALDPAGLPLGGRQRRDILLARTFRFDVIEPRTLGDVLEVPIELENTGGGHRVPAGFSQEREIWVHLRVTDARGALVYEVGRIDRPDEDLRDKRFLRVTTSDERTDRLGRPLGLFGADIADGPDVPRWDPPPDHGGTSFRGRGLINLQNGFLRCVRCIGRIDADGECQSLPGQEAHRAARFADGDYDIDTGECRSNLRGENALFEVFYPVGALDADRGVLKGPDAIVDTRSAPPGVPIRYTYELPVSGAAGPFTVEARLLFRAFPPFLLRAFADYESRQNLRGLRPSGPLITTESLTKLEVVEIAYVRTVVR